MIQKILAIAPASCLLLILTACQKNETTTNATSALSQTTTTNTKKTTTETKNISTTAFTDPTATALKIPTLTPAMQFWVDTNQGWVNKTVLQEHPNLTDKQKLCLKSAEGWNNYVSILKPYTEKVLTPAEIAEADKFYVSTTGMQFAMVFKQQMGITDPNMPPMPLDNAQKKAIADTMKKPFMAKMVASTDNMSEKDAEAFIQSMKDLELKRCQIQ